MKLFGKSRYEPFCVECRNHTEYEVKTKVFESDRALGSIKYNGFEVYCKKCGTTFSTPEIQDENISRLNAAYKGEML